MNSLFAKKPLSLLLEEMRGENRLKRVLGPGSLTSLGVGCVIGAGIFVVTGIVAHDKTGPSLILSFVVAGIACVLAALCYAEFASLAPVAGSAYTYAYATLGELFAWIIGWDLIIEYTVAAASITQGWSKYFQEFLTVFNVKIPTMFAATTLDMNSSGHLITTKSICDLPAVAIALIITIVLVLGIKESTRFNNAMVILKILIVLFVIGVGAFHINPANWHPFAPYGYAGISLFGKTILGKTGPGGAPLGMLAGAAIMFFAYIGFDSVSTHAEEARNPQRDVPIGIIASLIISTVLYIAVAAVLTGMVPSSKIDINAPVANAFRQVGLTKAHFFISLGALAGITSVILVLMLSQPRVLLAMARDGLLPKSFFGAVHPKFRTPYKSTILTGICVALLAAIIPLRLLAELVNIGTLLAFVIVCIAVLIMRHTHPQVHRPFKCPLVPWVPVLGILFCLMLMLSLPPANWCRLFVWMAIGMIVYFSYGRKHSIMAQIRMSDRREQELSPK